MKAALRKEIRLLLPAWLVAMSVSVFPVWLDGALGPYIPAREVVSLVFFAPGVLLLSLASFGLEISYGTFPSLLAKPRPRRDTWQMKIGLLASALIVVVAAADTSLCLRIWRDGISPHAEDFLLFYLLLASIAFAGGLWTTLLLRQMMAAFWFSFLVPCSLLYAFSVLEEGLGLDVTSMESFTFVSCGYALAGFFLARWLFFRAEDKPEREAADALACSFLPGFRTRRGPVAALLVKELRLQQGTLVIAIAMVIMHLAEVAAPEFLRPALAAKFQGIWMVWLAAPLLVACASVAEERRGRTLEGTLCLPISGPRQFVLKLLAVFSLGILLGAVLPWLLELLRPAAGANAWPIKEVGLPNLLLTAVILTSLGCYGSSLCNTLLQAIGAALLLGVALLAGMIWLWQRGPVQPFWAVLILVAIYLSYGHFKQLRVTRRQLLRDGTVWLAAIFAEIALRGVIVYWTSPPVFLK
jgi:hypothetical protein